MILFNHPLFCLYCECVSSLFLHADITFFLFFFFLSFSPLHTLLSLFLLILCLANVHHPLQHTLKHLSTHTHARTLTHTDHSVPPACRSVTDWLLPRRLGFVDVRNRTGTLDHRGHREDWCLSLLYPNPPSHFFTFSLLFPSIFIMTHISTYAHSLTLTDHCKGLYCICS